MKQALLADMVKGWFVGAFSPCAHATDACEVGVKNYKAGDHEDAHYHKIATEVTLILSGRVRMCGKEWASGDIITLFPEEITSFDALTDAVCVVVKTPGALNDKYMAGETG